MTESEPRLILAAGMPRSASTWLYNAARLILLSNPEIQQNFSYGWIGDLQQIPRKKHMLIKVHDFNEQLAQQAKIILYSFRDIRDAIASSVRKFNAAPSMEVADNMVAQDQLWSDKAHFIMRYEDMIGDSASVIEALATILGQPDIDIKNIRSALDGLEYNNPGSKNNLYHADNLYHKGHVTDGRHGSWVDTLEPGFIEDIETHHAKWLTSHGYQVSS